MDGKVVLGLDEYRDRVLACWLGKNIGGTLGGPWEGRQEVNDLTFYHPVPKEPLPNDDLDFQLVWLKMLEERGPAVNLPDFADYWKRYLHRYPWNEYGFCMRNLERGLTPPIAGWFENYYVDEMGSPIRSEIWACVAPAEPGRAAALAWLDSAMDHSGGEGMWGEMFWAAVESAAFVVKDPMTLIRIGLAMIPPSCGVARAIREVVWCRRNGKRWSEARHRVFTIFGHRQPCDAVQNHGFTVIGWLYGSGFGDKLCKAVNCGQDTDCTGATLGSLLGILGGTRGIPKKWIKPVGRGIRPHQFTGKFNCPKTVDELTRRTVAVARRSVSDLSRGVAFGKKTSLPENLEPLLMLNEEAIEAMRRDLRAGTVLSGDVEMILHYNGDPVLFPGVARRLEVSCRRAGGPVGRVQVTLHGPKGWRIEESGRGGGAFEVTAAGFSGTRYLSAEVIVDGERHHAEFAVLSAEEADGYPSAVNVETCPRCHARKSSCACGRR